MQTWPLQSKKTLWNRDSTPSLWVPRATMGTQNRYQKCREMCFENLVAAAQQVDETTGSAFTAACSFQRRDVALVAPGTVQTIVVNSVTTAGGTAEEWSDGDFTTVRGAEKLKEWITTKSPRLVWFYCPAENSTPSESCRPTAVQSRPRHQSREHRIQRHMSNLAADMASSGQ